MTAIDLADSRPLVASSTPVQKRKLAETDFEIPNSDDEDYGWQDEDSLPDMPPQWQGSEDILLGRLPESEDGDVEEDHSTGDDGQGEQDGQSGGNDADDSDDSTKDKTSGV